MASGTSGAAKAVLGSARAQFERIGGDFRRARLSVDRDEVAGLRLSGESAENNAGGTRAHVTVSGEEPNLIVEVKEHRRRHAI